MDLGKLRSKISEKYAEGIVLTDEGEEIVLRFPLLSVGDWGELKDKTGVDIWNILLSVSSNTDESKVAAMSEEEIAEMQKQTSLNLLKKIDQKTQILMIYLSMRRYHEGVTMDSVDHIVTYGMDQQEYIKVINFLIYGINSDQIKELKEASESKNVVKAPAKKKAKTPSKVEE